ncbi:hypothetical protein ABW21_db0202056 [Orbilia brochopaga]|nr:hypothetical protein ABW21_db0202056 [Drechslerella brochopaga]
MHLKFPLFLLSLLLTTTTLTHALSLDYGKPLRQLFNRAKIDFSYPPYTLIAVGSDGFTTTITVTFTTIKYPTATQPACATVTRTSYLTRTLVQTIIRNYVEIRPTTITATKISTVIETRTRVRTKYIRVTAGGSSSSASSRASSNASNMASSTGTGTGTGSSAKSTSGTARNLRDEYNETPMNVFFTTAMYLESIGVRKY